MTKILSILFVIFVYMTCSQVDTKLREENIKDTVAQPTVNQGDETCTTMNFHYLVTENSQYTSTVRSIKIFLEDSAFSEENLKILFKYFSDKNPESKILLIVVNTNWAQIPFPSDCPPIAISNQPDRPDKYDYHQAVYRRTDKDEYFRYNPILKTSEFKTVIIRGKINNE